MKFVNRIYVNMMEKVESFKSNENGSQTLEWIGIAAVVVIVVGLISTAFANSGFGGTIVSKFDEFLSNIGGG
ncbi:hypothetical protein QGM71_15765 [Virgibacillus sp. C22-A2]|uniref:Flp pilus assembly protein, pilin Flp n=1 Tax=Virgibacillus tibetensis TaxID=3042313 RepID=A0ABU6KJB7_9BACI|nr:hypothetical protein [Virgibacillus sp. C22-A2]